MANFDLQNALSVTYANASTKDKLRVIYGAILANIKANADFASLVNTQYSMNPVKGGSVHVDRLAFATVNDYGTAHSANAGVAVRNNGVDILVNIDKEIITEIAKKDMHLWREGDANIELLARNYENQAAAMSIFLDDAYFVALQTAAATVDLSSKTALVDKLLLFIQTAEATTGDNINKIDRSNLVMTLGSAWYDQMVTYLTTLPNAQNAEAKGFYGVEVRRALRQDVDAVIQARGAMAMPMVIDTYEAIKPPYKNAISQQLFFSYGIGAVMPEAIFKAALDLSNNISL
jgi:hypothetical protein